MMTDSSLHEFFVHTQKAEAKLAIIFIVDHSVSLKITHHKVDLILIESLAIIQYIHERYVILKHYVGLSNILRVQS